MKRNLSLNYHMYEWMLKSINNMSLHDDQLGEESELNFLRANDWLGDTAVIERLVYRAGQYRIDLLFAHHQQPLKLLIRNITVQSSKSKAEIMSQLFRRQAAKDQRGTLSISEDLLDLMYN
jgi:hypothetical protein